MQSAVATKKNDLKDMGHGNNVVLAMLQVDMKRHEYGENVFLVDESH